MFNLNNIPRRETKPRNYGLNMVMDKGLSVEETKHFIARAKDHVDYVKFGFGTSFVTQHILKEKINLYTANNISVYLGGTLFEAFVYRNQFEDYVKLLKELSITCVEVSDGSISISQHEKCEYIKLLSKNFEVLSEVGSKDATKIISPARWVSMMKQEIDSGATYVIAEARESGTAGLFEGSGEVKQDLVQNIITHIPTEKIIWEAPKKDQQKYFIQLVDANVNLGNIHPDEVIALEAMRLGLRGDTFFTFLDKK